MNNFNEFFNKDIIIIQYPLGQLSYSNGIIKKIDKYEFTQLSSTLNGSSGSTVFLKDNIKVIGIHKSTNKKLMKIIVILLDLYLIILKIDLIIKYI